MPGWACGWSATIAGDRITRVPIEEIDDDRQRRASQMHGASELGLHKVENRVAAWIPRKGAM